ncbi:hypothetical protein DJ71_02165 [Halorubrum sp. E3]|nr:hypothetical protein DJ71_02165 [Halorubrum sp. E3]
MVAFSAYVARVSDCADLVFELLFLEYFRDIFPLCHDVTMRTSSIAIIYRALVWIEFTLRNVVWHSHTLKINLCVV